MKAVWKREMQGYFYTPVGYVFIGVFLAISSVLFYLEILSPRSSNLPGIVAGKYLAAVTVLLIAIAVTLL